MAFVHGVRLALARVALVCVCFKSADGLVHKGGRVCVSREARSTRTVLEKVDELLVQHLDELLFGDVVFKKRQHIVSEHVGVCIAAVSAHVTELHAHGLELADEPLLHRRCVVLGKEHPWRWMEPAA